MHREVLTKGQTALFPLLAKVGKKFGLVGGTAIALHIGHRRSIDFDLFSYKGFRNIDLKKIASAVAKFDEILVDKRGEFTFFAKRVKVTFYHYPFAIDYQESFEKMIRVPDLITLAAMKAYALGRRAKWKDYVDLYFIMRDFHSMSAIIERAELIFGHEFNSKIFRVQLSYFADVSYEEKIEFLPGWEVSEAKIKRRLTEFSLER